MAMDCDFMKAPAPEELSELLWRSDENCREMFRLLARCAYGTIQEHGDITMVATGVDISLFNPVFAPESTDIKELAECAEAFYGPRKLPWALVSNGHAPVASRVVLAKCGLTEVQTMPILTREVEPDADWPEGASVTIRIAEDETTLADHRDLLTCCFGIPEEMAQKALPRCPAPLMRLYVAYDNGRAVGAGALCEAAGLAGIYNVGTIPDYRRRGVAAAVLRRILADAGDRGLKTCILQSTTAGMPLYTRFGFSRLSTYVIYTT